MSQKIVKKIVLGSAQFGLKYGVNNKSGIVKYKEMKNIMNYAFSNGINTIDSSIFYGASLDKIIKYLEEHKNQVWNINLKHNNNFNLNEKISHIKKINPNNKIELMLHSFENFKKNFYINKENYFNKKKYSFSLYKIKELNFLLNNKIKIKTIQAPGNLFDKRFVSNNILEILKSYNIKLHVRSLFLQGLFFMKKPKLLKIHPELKTTLNKISKIQLKYNLNLYQLSLVAIIYNKNVNRVVLGFDNIQQFKSIINFLKNCKIDNFLISELDKISFNMYKIILPTEWK